MYRKYASIVIILMLLVGSFAVLSVQPVRAADLEPGWDFEDHGYDHSAFTGLTNGQIVWQLENTSAAFQAHGLPLPEHFAYPSGSFDERVISVVSQYRKSGRTAGSGFLYFPETYPVQEWYTLSAATVSTLVSWTTIQGWIDLAISKKGLLNLFTHDVNETHTTYGVTPELLAQVLDYLVVKQNAGQLFVMTMREAYDSFDGSKAVVVFAFDDGYATTYTTAWPMFKARGLKGTSYLNTHSQDINNPGSLSWAMVEEMAQPWSPNWSISISSSPSNLGTTTPSGLQDVTGKLTVTAYPVTGYHFLYWLFDGYQLTDNPVALPAQPNETSHTLTAFFSKTIGLVLDNPPDKPVNPNPSSGANGVSTSVTLSASVSDPDQDPMNVSFYKWGTQNFTIVALPDTQYYSASYPWIFDNQTKWIVNNVGSKNIVFVTHEGDIVDTWNSTAQWQNANRSMSKLDGYVPYGVLPGNHDLALNGNFTNGVNATYYNTYFGYARFSGESWYGGAYQTNNNTNSYQLFSVGADDYLIFHFQTTPSYDVLEWANSTIANYPNRRVIVTTHSYLNADGSRTDAGNEIWYGFVEHHADQIFLVLCGHIRAGVGQRIDVVSGHYVYQLLADYQDYSSQQSGLLRIYKFCPALDKIYVSTYSPYTNSYLADYKNQFTIDYDMTSSPAAPPELIGTVNDIPSGDVASIQWSGLSHSTTYKWFAVAKDPDGLLRQSDVWNFTTGPETYTLTVISSPVEGGSVNLNDTGPHHYGDHVELTAVPNLGWSFSSWSGDLSGSANPAVITMDGNKTVTAIFIQDEYSLDVVVSPLEGGSVSLNNSGPYHYGDWVELTATANSGWSFISWSGDVSGADNPVDIFIDGNKVVTASFTQLEYSLTVFVFPVDGGSVGLNNTGPYYYGDVVELTATPAVGYSFGYWSDDLSGSTNPSVITINGNKVVTANFVQLEYTLTVTVDPVEAGSVTLNNTGPYHYGDWVRLTAVANLGWAFSQWSGDASGTSVQVDVFIDGDKSVTASFVRTGYVLTVGVSGHGSTNVTGAHVYDEFTNVTVLASPASGWFFDHWILNELDVGSVNPYTLNMTGDFDLTAVFLAYQRTLTVTVVGNGVTNATGTFSYDLFSNVTVLATPDLGYRLDYWTLNGSLAGSVNPYTVNMTGNFDLTAVFTQIQYNYLVVRGSDNRIYYRFYNDSSGSWQDWNVLPEGSTPDSPAAVLYSGKLYIVVRGSEGYTIWFSWVNLSDYSFSGWTMLSGETESAPTLVQYGSSLVLVVRGLNNWIYYRFYDCVSGIWGDWMYTPSGATIDSPAAAVLGDELHVVVRSDDGGSIWHSFINMSSNEFSGWQLVGGATNSRPVLAASESRNELYLVVRGLEGGKVYYNVWGGGVWSGWVALPDGSTCDGPGAVVVNNKLNLVVRGSEGPTLFYGYIDLNTSGFSGWSLIDGSTNNAPTLTR